jgi:hypothetical protein
MKQLLKRVGRNDKRALIGLGVVSLLTHFHWLLDPRVFTSGDWWFISIAKYHDFASFSPIWVTDGLGGTSATPGFYLIRFFEGLLTYLGSNFALNEKLFFFVPITLFGAIGTYIFLRQYFKEWLSFIGAIVFAFNTAMLFNYAGAMTIAVADAMTPFTLFLFRKFLFSPRDNRLMLAAAGAFGVMSFYEMRIALLVMAIAGGLFVYNLVTDEAKWEYLRERLWPLAKLGLVLGGLQAFWLLPYMIGARSGVTFSNLLGQNLFVSFSNIQNALTLQHPFWTNARPATFIPQAVPWFAWIIPLLAFGGLLFQRQRIHKDLGYWALLAIAGLFLVKQVNEPLISAYPWLFSHIPGFAAFRESSKFYLLIALSYSVLIPYTLAVSKQWLRAHWKKKIGRVQFSSAAFMTASIIVLMLFAVNMKPLLTGDLRTLYVPRQMPQDYAELNKFLGDQQDYFRLMWMPTVSRWAAQTSVHPSLSATNITQGSWLTQLSNANLGAGATLRDKASNVFAHGTSDAFLDRASVKYVIVPLRDAGNDDDFFRSYGDDRDYYLDQLNKTSYLKRVDIGSNQLAVYENQHYQPYVSAAASTQQFSLQTDTQLDPLHTFTTKQLGQPFNFVDGSVLQKTHSTIPTTRITDLFQDISPAQVQQAGVTKKIAPTHKPELYIDTHAQDVRYTIQKGVITFYGKPRNNLQVNGKAAGSANSKETTLASGKLMPGVTYLLGVKDALVQLDSSRNTAETLGVPDGSVRLYATAGKNALANGSFEQGLWQKKVQDCNNYDDTKYITMDLNKDDSTDGYNSLQLAADKHTACTTSPATAVAAGRYLLKFDYQTWGGQTAGYEVTFNDPHKTRIKKDITGNGKWQTYQTVIDTPTGATSFTVRLLGYPDYRFRNHAITGYDNARMTPLTRLVNLEKPAPNYTTLPLPANQPLNFTYSNSSKEQGKNLITDGSFEQGLWQKKVQDCNNYDDDPSINMQLVGRDDGQALELNAHRHAACTSHTNIPVHQNVTHLLSFDYQSPNASRASYSLKYDDVNGTTVEGSLSIKNTQWQTLTKQIQPPLGATHLAITVYSYGDESGSKKIINRYDNFSLTEVPTAIAQYYLVEAAPISTTVPAHITSTKQNATKTTIQVTGATQPFYVSMSESYNPLWRLELNNHRSQSLPARIFPWSKTDAVPNGQHFRLNDFENGWYVDPAVLCAGNKQGCEQRADGSYDIKLVAEFTSQRWFYMGSIVTGVTVGIAALYLTVRRSRKRQRIWQERRR